MKWDCCTYVYTGLPYTGWWGTFPAGTHHSHKLWGCIYPDIPEHTSWAALGTAACCVSSYEWPLLSPLGHNTRADGLHQTEACRDTCQYSHATFKQSRSGNWLMIFLFLSYAPHLFRHTVVVDLQCILLFVVVRRNNHPNHNNNLTYKKINKNRKNRLTWRLKDFTHTAGNNNPPLIFWAYSNELSAPLLFIVYVCTTAWP